MVNHAQSESSQPYYRRLPGGGFVFIEIKPVRTRFGRRRYRGDVVVERRISAERRIGHDAPAVASAEADTAWSVLDELFPLAQSNPALASCCLALSGRNTAAMPRSYRGFRDRGEVGARP